MILIMINNQLLFTPNYIFSYLNIINIQSEIQILLLFKKTYLLLKKNCKIILFLKILRLILLRNKTKLVAFRNIYHTIFVSNRKSNFVKSTFYNTPLSENQTASVEVPDL